MDLKLWPTLSWFAGFLIMTSLVGFILALIIFFTFLSLQSKSFFFKNNIIFICRVNFYLHNGMAFVRDFPSGLLQNYMSFHGY